MRHGHASRLPCRQTAIKHAHISKPRPAQNPPGARRRHVAVIIIYNHRPAMLQAPASRTSLKRVDIRQRSLSTLARGWPGKFRVNLSVHSTGHTAGPIRNPASIGIHGLHREDRRWFDPFHHIPKLRRRNKVAIAPVFGHELPPA